jgi:hypothetical protein
VSARKILPLARGADEVADVAQMPHEAALDTAQGGVGVAGAHHGGGDDGRVGADHGARGIGSDAPAPGRLDIEVDIFAIARVFLRVDEDEITPRPDR